MNDTQTNSARPPFEIPQRWLTSAAAIVLLAMMAAGAFSVIEWVKDGSPPVPASFGRNGGGPGGRGPGFGPGQQPVGPGQQNQGVPQQPGGPNQGVPQRQNGQQGSVLPNGGQVPNGGQQPNGGSVNVPAGLSRVPDLTGTVRAINATSFTIDTPTGSRTLAVNASTRVFLGDGSSASISDLAPGARIAVVLAAGGQAASEIARLGR